MSLFVNEADHPELSHGRVTGWDRDKFFSTSSCNNIEPNDFPYTATSAIIRVKSTAERDHPGTQTGREEEQHYH